MESSVTTMDTCGSFSFIFFKSVCGSFYLIFFKSACGLFSLIFFDACELFSLIFSILLKGCLYSHIAYIDGCHCMESIWG